MEAVLVKTTVSLINLLARSRGKHSVIRQHGVFYLLDLYLHVCVGTSVFIYKAKIWV